MEDGENSKNSKEAWEVGERVSGEGGQGKKMLWI